MREKPRKGMRVRPTREAQRRLGYASGVRGTVLSNRDCVHRKPRKTKDVVRETGWLTPAQFFAAAAGEPPHGTCEQCGRVLQEKAPE